MGAHEQPNTIVLQAKASLYCRRTAVQPLAAEAAITCSVISVWTPSRGVCTQYSYADSSIVLCVHQTVIIVAIAAALVQAVVAPGGVLHVDIGVHTGGEAEGETQANRRHVCARERNAASTPSTRALRGL